MSIQEEFASQTQLGSFALADAYTRLRARAVEMEKALAAVEQDPFQSEDYQRFQAEVAKTCESPDAPCDGCLAGGICDGPDYPRHEFDEQDHMDRDSY